MTKKGTFGLALIAMIAAMVAGPARTQAPAPEYSYPPLSAEAHKYYDQHPDEFQQLLKRLPPVSHEIVPGTLLPAGAVPAGGSWTSLNHPLGQNLSNPILLTDGTVIAHVSCTSNWYKFTPDNTGSYNNGTWAAIASLPSGYAPRFFGSGVLPDGRVIIEGGEYNGTGCGGRTKLGAIYDPVANSWTAVDPPAGWGTISDAAGIVLASGIYMQTSCCDNPPHAALLNPSNLTWTNTGSGKFDPYDEESMALLPDGTVLTVDAYTQTGTCGTGSERYNPTTGSWSSAGATIIQQADCAPNRSFEVGPLVMRPNGTAVSFSGVTTANGSAVVIEACPDRSPFQASAVAAQNLLVGGGQPISGYTWTVTSGSTLPNGIVLDNLTGVIHGNGNPPNVPPAGSVLDIPITVTDNQGSTIHTAPGTFVLEVQNPGDGNPCGLPTFQVLAGPIPLTATPGAPYAVTLSVVGGTPPYTWQLATGSFLPAGLILDQSTGVVRGTPSQSTAGQTFNFSVRVTDNTGGPALVQNAYSLTVCNSGTVPCQGLALQFPGSSGLPGTAIYHTSTNTWSAGPVIPSVNGVPYTLADAPAAVLPNGNILFAASPSNWPAKDTFPKPTHFFEMNIADDSITQVADKSDAGNFASYQQNLLVLPTGQVMAFTVDGPTVQIYTPSGTFDPSWRPTITSVPTALATGGTYQLSGTQLNGLTEGAYYGDDTNASTHFPLVRITNTASGHVFYARTVGHSTRSIAPNAASSTNFVVPAGIETGSSKLEVVANGIPSLPTTVTIATGVSTLQVSPATDIASSGAQGGPFAPSSFSYQLSATSGSLNYSISGVPNWLTASSTSGTVTTSATTVTFTVNANANGMAPGAYSSTITFTNSTNGQGTQTRSATLTVASPGPANDNFANATTIQPGQTLTASNVGATKESGEPSIAGNVGGHSVWWTFTAQASGQTVVSTEGSNFDTLLGVYIGTSVSALTLIGENDDVVPGTDVTSQVTFNATAGTTYHFAVDGFNDGTGAASGNVQINLTAPTAAALAVSPASDIAASGNQGGPFSPSSFNYQLSASASSVNYSITGVPSWLTASSTSGTVTTAATTVTFTVNANANTLSPGTYSSTITFTNTTNGQGNQTRTATLTVNAAGGGPSNDNFASATTIDLGQTKTGTNVGASKEAGEPNLSFSTGGKSVWWNWQAPSSGPVKITTIGSSFDTMLGVFTGSAVNALTLVAANDDIDFNGGILTSAVTFTASAGAIYRIMVDGYNDGTGAASGNVQLAVLDNGTAGATAIVAAVAPTARTTTVGTAVTGFATIINGGAVTATSCSIALPAGVPANFLYQTTDPATNQPIGTPNTPVNIGAGQPQTFYFAIIPTAAFSTDIALVFDCTNSNPATVVPGLNTFLVAASAAAIPDMLSIADTLTHDGKIGIAGTGGTGLMVVASINIGAAGTVTFTPTDTAVGQLAQNLPLTLSICQTDPTTGACINPASPGPSSTVTVAHNQTVFFSIFVGGQGTAVPYDPANNRIFSLAKQNTTPVGEASAAVNMQ